METSTTKNSYPEEIDFEITCECNLRCPTCFFSDSFFNQKKDELTTDQLLSCFQRIPSKIPVFRFIGAEPLMRKDLITVFGELTHRKHDVYLFTNGMLLTPELSDKLYRLRVIKRIHVSLDGVDAIHDVARGSSGVFALVSKNLIYAAKYFHIHLNMVVLKKNVFYMKELISFLDRLENYTISLSLVREYTKEAIAQTAISLGMDEKEMHLREFAPTLSDLDPSAICKNILEFRNELSKRNVSLLLMPNDMLEHIEELISPIWSTLDGQWSCALKNRLRIDGFGNVMHCFAVRKVFGSLLKNGLEEIWNSHEYTSFRNSLSQGHLFPVCSHCCHLKRL